MESWSKWLWTWGGCSKPDRLSEYFCKLPMCWDFSCVVKCGVYKKGGRAVFWVKIMNKSLLIAREEVTSKLRKTLWTPLLNLDGQQKTAGWAWSHLLSAWNWKLTNISRSDDSWFLMQWWDGGFLNTLLALAEICLVTTSFTKCWWPHP